MSDAKVEPAPTPQAPATPQSPPTLPSHEPDERVKLIVPRGGLSLMAVLTGTLVGLSALAIVSLAGAAAFEFSGYSYTALVSPETRDARILWGAFVVLIPFLSFLWAGYVAGRMGRGSGLLHGLLAAMIGIGVAMGAIWGFDSLWYPGRVAGIVEERFLPAYVALAVGLATLVGSAVGGALGVRWHRRLERKALDKGHDAR